MAYATTTALASEATARKTADTTLQKEIDALTIRAKAIEARLAALEAKPTVSTTLPSTLPMPVGP